ncbi:MAG: maleylacetate reductase [Variovorax sp.]|nr:MAG: maleylacetate reductase [Variovorax sp.]
MKDFTYTPNAQRVVFGSGCLEQLQQELERLGIQHALVLCTPQQREDAQRIAARLGPTCAGVFDRAAMHVPAALASDASAHARQLGADGLVAFGGGSTTGLAKAIALEEGLPILAIPTTYAGSEVTSIYGVTGAGVKRTGKDPRVLPKTVLYDPTLTHSLPRHVSITSGINAIAHAAEGLYAKDANPVISMMALEGAGALAQALPMIAGSDEAAAVGARARALYGAWLCGTVLGHVGMGLHHKLCHTLGGTFDLPHADTHTVVLPHALAYNEAAAPEPLARFATALGRPGIGAGAAAFDLALACGAPTSLALLGLQERDLDEACDLALQNRYDNPRALERPALRALLQDAYEGRRPG